MLITGCSVKWADHIADKGFDKEAINDYGKAMKIYNRGIVFNKKSAELYWRRGCLHARNNNHVSAIEDLTKSIAIDSLFDGGYPYWDRAISKLELGDSLGALSDYNKAVLISPEQGNFYCYRGILKYKMNDNQGALSDFNNSIKYWENFYLARSYRSTLRIKMGDYLGALEDFNFMSLDEKDESDAWEFRYRGVAKFETHDTIGACSDWKIAAKHNDSISLVKIKKYCR